MPYCCPSPLLVVCVVHLYANPFSEDFPLLWRKIDILSHAFLPALRRTADCLSGATALEALKHVATSSCSFPGAAFSQGEADLPSAAPPRSSPEDVASSWKEREHMSVVREGGREVERKVFTATSLANLWISALRAFLSEDLLVAVPLPLEAETRGSTEGNSWDTERRQPPREATGESPGDGTRIAEEGGRAEEEEKEHEEKEKKRGEEDPATRATKASRYHQESLVSLAFIGMSAAEYAPRLLEYILRLIVGDKNTPSDFLTPERNGSRHLMVNSVFRHRIGAPAHAGVAHQGFEDERPNASTDASSAPGGTRRSCSSSAEADGFSVQEGAVSEEKNFAGEGREKLSVPRASLPDLMKECFVLTRDFLLSLLEGLLATCRDTRDEETEEGLGENDEEEMLNLAVDGFSSFSAFCAEGRAGDRKREEHEEDSWWGRMGRQNMERLVGDGEEGEAVKKLLKRLLQNDEEQAGKCTYILHHS